MAHLLGISLENTRISLENTRISLENTRISLENTRILIRDSLNKIHATREAVAWMYCDIVSGSSKVVTEPAMRDDVLISSSFSFCCCRRDSRNRSHSHSRTHIRSGSCHSGSLRRHR